MASVGVRMLVANYPPHGGGSERQCALLARRLIDLGDRVSVVTRRLDGEPTANGVRVRRIGAPVGLRAARAALFSAAALVDLLREREQYDVVHCHGFEALALVGAATRALAGKKLVVKVVTSGAFGDVTRLGAFPAGRSIARILARADAVLVLNDEARQEVIGVGVAPEKVSLVPNGVELPPSAVGGRDSDFAFCGRLVEQKNVAGLIRAWSRTRASQQRRLVVAGDGPLRPALEALARDLGDKVVFRGRVDDARALVARVQAVVLFSHAEGLSNVVLEAMAAGTPVIASDVAGNTDLVRHDETGLLVAASDEQALTAAIDRLADDAALRANLGRAARQLAARYDIADVAKRVHGVYERVLRTGC